jgi:hypothetical protein
MYCLGEPMSAFEEKTPGRLRATWSHPLLLPATFRWRDPATNLVHHGAVIKRREGHVLGFTVLCTDVLEPRWDDPQPDEDSFISCLECLGAREQDE